MKRYTFEGDHGRWSAEFDTLGPIIGLARDCRDRGVPYRIYTADGEGEYFPDGTQRWHHGLSAAELQTLERHGVEVEG